MDGAHRFNRTRGRVLIDLVMVPLGALLFLAVAIGSIVIIPANPLAIVGVVGFGFFGLLMGDWALTSMRRGVRLTILEVSPQGIWTPESGRLRWDEVREVRLEQATAAPHGRVRGASSGSRRLGIWPTAAAAAAAGLRPGRAGYLARVHWFSPASRMASLAQVAPWGVSAYELDVPLEAVIAAIEAHTPVLDTKGRLLRPEDEGRWRDHVREGPAPTSAAYVAAMRNPGRSRLTEADIHRIDATITTLALPTAGSSGSVADVAISTPSIVPARQVVDRGIALDEVPLDRTYAFGLRPSVRSRALGDLGNAIIYIAVPLLGGGFVVWILPQMAVPPIVLVAILAFVGVFVLSGLSPAVTALARLDLASGHEVPLSVGPAGLAIRGRRAIAWRDIASIRVDRTELIEDEGPAPDRPRLTIIPRDRRRLTERGRIERLAGSVPRSMRRLVPWRDRTRLEPGILVDLDLLDVDPDEVIDLVDRFRRVELH